MRVTKAELDEMSTPHLPPTATKNTQVISTCRLTEGVTSNNSGLKSASTPAPLTRSFASIAAQAPTATVSKPAMSLSSIPECNLPPVISDDPATVSLIGEQTGSAVHEKVPGNTQEQKDDAGHSDDDATPLPKIKATRLVSKKSKKVRKTVELPCKVPCPFFGVNHYWQPRRNGSNVWRTKAKEETQAEVWCPAKEGKARSGS
jgi:hypothetical protein